QQLSEVFPEKSPTVLVLGEPCSCQRCSTCSIALLIHLCQGWDHEHPAQEANQGKYDRDGACEGRNPECCVVTPPEHRRQKQDRHEQDGIRPRRGEPRPYKE